MLTLAKSIFSILDYFLHTDCDMGDWFVLHQISKNVDFYYFNQFMHHLIAEEIIDNQINEIKEKSSNENRQISMKPNESECWDESSQSFSDSYSSSNSNVSQNKKSSSYDLNNI